MQGLASIIMPAHNKAAYTERALEAHIRNRYRPLELILVDNGSSDGTASLFESFARDAGKKGIGVKIITKSRNVGAIKGRNEALKMAGGQYIVFVDNDVVPMDSGWLEKLARFLDATPGAGAVGPKLIFPFEPYLIQFAGGAVTKTGRVAFLGRGERRDDPRFNEAREVQCAISACLVIRRECVEAAGPLDERFSPVQYEDIDYCYRLRGLGWKVWYCPEVEMYHFDHVTTNRTRELKSRYLTIKNGMKFKRKWAHVFSKEDGPDDKDVKFADIKEVAIEDIGTLEFRG